MADYVANAAANHVPIFGVAGTVKLDGGSPGPFDGVSAKDWDIVSVAVNPGSDMVEHRNSVGQREARPRADLPLVSRRNRERNAGANQETAKGGDAQRLRRAPIGPRHVCM
jgi:hypothetical protein